MFQLRISGWSGEWSLKLVKSGLSMSLMSCLVSFGTVSLQSAINQMGTAVIVAHTATRKLFEIIMVPSMVLSAAMATFSGQNYGAGRLDRIRAGLKSALLIGLGWSGIAIALIYLTANYLIRFIASSSNPEVIYWGVTYIRLNVLFLIVCLCVCVLRNTMQGFGNRKIPVISSLIELVGKVIFAFCPGSGSGILGNHLVRAGGLVCHGDPAGGQYRADVPAKRRLNLRKKEGVGSGADFASRTNRRQMSEKTTKCREMMVDLHLSKR